MNTMEPLLKLLRENASYSSAQLAQLLDMEESEVKTRIQALEDESPGGPICLDLPSADFRASAVWSLGILGNPAAVPALRSALKDAYWLVRRSAAEALGQIGDTTAIPTLQKTLKDRATLRLPLLPLPTPMAVHLLNSSLLFMYLCIIYD